MTTAHARRSDPITSHQAAFRISASLNRLEQLVIDTLTEYGGMTTKELSEHTGEDRVTISPRVKPLRDKGRIIDSGIKRGRSIVWQVVCDGI